MTPISLDIIFSDYPNFDMLCSDCPDFKIVNLKVITKVSKNSFMFWSSLLYDFDRILEIHIISIFSKTGK